MPPRKKAVSRLNACRKMEMLIKKHGCRAEVVGMGYPDFVPIKKAFIAIINLSGKEADVIELQEFLTHEEHGKINGFAVQFFVRGTIH